MCLRGMMSTWVGACGLRSRKATARSSSLTIFAGMLPSTILQKRQSAHDARTLAHEAAARGDAGTWGGSTRRRTTIGSTTPTCRAVARMLDELDPDVVLLQEIVDARQLDEILARLSRCARPSPARWRSAAPTIAAPPCSCASRTRRRSKQRSLGSTESQRGDGHVRRRRRAARGGDLRRTSTSSIPRGAPSRPTTLARARRRSRAKTWCSPAATSTSTRRGRRAPAARSTSPRSRD